VDVDRKEQIVHRLIECVVEYHHAFGKGMGMHILSAKYSRALKDVGGFPELIEELRKEGLVQVSIRETGGKDIWPIQAKVTLPEGCVMLGKDK
jgi:hypothetical protein